MSGPRTLPTEQSADLVTIEVFSDGERIPASVQVLGMGITKSVNRIPFASIVIKDGDPSKETFDISTGELFAPGRWITLTMGYHNDNETLFEGMVVRHRLSARTLSGPVLHVECKDAAFKMTGGRQNRFFKEQTDSEIIRHLLDHYGLNHEVEDDGIQHLQMVQYHASDWDFMLCRAEMNDYVVMVEDGKVAVRKPDVSDPVLELTFGATILEFEAGLDIQLQTSTIESRSWNIANQELSISEADQQAELNLSSRLHHGGNRTEAELQKWVQAAQTKSRLTAKRG
ncbi:hypothetical protein QLX67_14180, partial [Balneolaceae bacterium ANBcel3]|nr:hypothetical protein [Balneolaceae bacterium ANBcel3]